MLLFALIQSSSYGYVKAYHLEKKKKEEIFMLVLAPSLHFIFLQYTGICISLENFVGFTF